MREQQTEAACGKLLTGVVQEAAVQGPARTIVRCTFTEGFEVGLQSMTLSLTPLVLLLLFPAGGGHGGAGGLVEGGRFAERSVQPREGWHQQQQGTKHAT